MVLHLYYKQEVAAVRQIQNKTQIILLGKEAYSNCLFVKYFSISLKKNM